MTTPRPTAVPTREAQLASLRQWHAARFGPSPSPSPSAAVGPVIIVAASDSLVAVDPSTGEVVTP